MKSKEQQEQAIKKLVARTDSELLKDVAATLLDESDGYDDGIAGCIRDLQQGGCQSGMIGELVYHSQTHKFFDKHSDEIFELLDEIKENTGMEFSNYQGDRKNTLAWLAFEETTCKIAEEIGIEL